MSVTVFPNNSFPKFGNEEDLNSLLVDLHKEIEALKHKNSELLFQLYVNCSCECQTKSSTEENCKRIAGFEEMKQLINDINGSKELRTKYEQELAKNLMLAEELNELKNLKPKAVANNEVIVKIPRNQNPIGNLKLKSSLVNRSFPETQVRKKVQIFEQKSKSDIKPFNKPIPIPKTRISTSDASSRINESKIKPMTMTHTVRGRPVPGTQPQDSRKQNSANAKPVPIGPWTSASTVLNWVRANGVQPGVSRRQAQWDQTLQILNELEKANPATAIRGQHK